MKNIPFLGWCYEKDSSGRVAHDKIWGIITAQGENVVFWGRRDKKLTFKKAADYDDVFKTARAKEDKGYNSSSMEEMKSVDPDFEQRFEEAIILCQLGNFFHRNPNEER